MVESVDTAQGDLELIQGNFEKALLLYELELGKIQASLGLNSQEAALLQYKIGTAQARLGKLDLALDHFQNSLKIQLEKSQETIPISNCYNDIANIKKLQNKFDESLEFYDKSVNIRIKILGEDDETVGNVINNLGNLYYDKKENEKALSNYEKALKIFQQKLGDEDQKIAIVEYRIGVILEEQGKVKEAILKYEKAMSIKIKHQGENDLAVSEVQMNLFTAYLRVQNFEKSFENINKVIATRKLKLGEFHVSVADGYLKLNDLYLIQKDFKNACEILGKALTIYKKVNWQKDTADIYCKLGNIYEAQKLFPGALTFYIKAQQIFQSEKDCIMQSAEVLISLSRIYEKMDNFQDAIKSVQQSLQIKMSNKAQDIEIIENYLRFGHIYKKLGQFQQAQEVYQNIMMIYMKHQQEEQYKSDLRILEVFDSLAFLFQLKGDIKSASKFFESEIAMKKQIFGANHLILAESYYKYSALFLSEQNLTKVCELLQQSLDIFLKNNHMDIHTSDVYFQLGVCQEVMNKTQESLTQFLKCYEIREKILNKTNAKQLTEVVTKIINLYGHQKKIEEAVKIIDITTELFEKNQESMQQILLLQLKGNLFASQLQIQEAIQCFDKCLQLLKNQADSQELNQTIVGIYTDYSNFCADQNDYEKAIKLQEEIIKFKQVKYPKEDIFIAENFNYIGVFLESLNKFEEAENNYKKCMEIAYKHQDKLELLFVIYINMAKLYKAQNKLKEAKDYLLQLQDILVSKVGKDHQMTKDVIQKIEEIKL